MGVPRPNHEQLGPAAAASDCCQSRLSCCCCRPRVRRLSEEAVPGSRRSSGAVRGTFRRVHAGRLDPSSRDFCSPPGKKWLRFRTGVRRLLTAPAALLSVAPLNRSYFSRIVFGVCGTCSVIGSRAGANSPADRTLNERCLGAVATRNMSAL